MIKIGLQSKSNKQSKKSVLVLDKDSAIAIGIVGIILPVGIQDFVDKVSYLVFWPIAVGADYKHRVNSSSYHDFFS